MKAKPSYEAFSKGLEEEKLIGARCEECERVSTPPRKICPHCGSEETEITELKGSGKIDVFTVIYVSPPQLKEKAPYPVAVVELEEGPKLMGRLLDVNPNKPEEIEPGTEVEFRVIEENEEKVVAFSPIN